MASCLEIFHPPGRCAAAVLLDALHLCCSHEPYATIKLDGYDFGSQWSNIWTWSFADKVSGGRSEALQQRRSQLRKTSKQLLQGCGACALHGDTAQRHSADKIAECPWISNQSPVKKLHAPCLRLLPLQAHHMSSTLHPHSQDGRREAHGDAYSAQARNRLSGLQVSQILSLNMHCEILSEAKPKR